MSFLPSTTSVRNLNLAAAAADVCDVEDQQNRYTNTTIRGIPFPSELDSPSTSSAPTFMNTPDFPSSSSYRDIRRHRRSFRCVCGRRVDADSGMYCSPDCARSDTFSSLTHTRHNSSTHPDGPYDADDYDASNSRHRRAVRADPYRTDLTREERRRKQRADGSDSISPMSARNLMLSPSVPELVSSHSRNTSTASSVFSLSSMSSSMSLSRNPSTSSRSVALNGVILEDAREDLSSCRSTLKSSRRSHSVDNDAPPTKRLAVNDMLDEIISMQNEFDNDMGVADIHADFEMPSTPEHVAFSPVIRPPRTPSPPPSGGKALPAAPGAPDRRGTDRRRGSLVRSRPMSNLAAHASSLSESHTALFLATASPAAPPPASKQDLRRSASPKLHLRRSISFTPQAAGPALSAAPRNRYNDSPGLTPVRRKPNALRATMDAWRFPTSSSSPAVLEIEGTTPTAASRVAQPQTPIQPALLWPHSHVTHEEQEPAHPRQNNRSASPNSPSFGMNLSRHSRTLSSQSISPPRSGVRLGALLGLSGSASDMDMEDDDRTIRDRDSIRQSLQAPVAPFAQPGWQ